MSDRLNLLAFDLGASNGRAILAKYDGEKIDFEEVHNFVNGSVSFNGHDYWDILHIFQEIKKAIVSIKNKGQLSSIGVDTWGVDYALLDDDGNLMSYPHHYRDNRTENLLDEIYQFISREELFQCTGVQPMQINTLVQLYADLKQRPWILNNAASLLFMPDIINYYLSGEKYNEHTIASTSQLFDPFTEKWAKDIISRLRLPFHIFQEIIYPGEEIGKIRDEITNELNLKIKPSITAVGSHDTASAVFAAPIVDRGKSIFISSGTWSLLGMEVDSPIVSKEALQAGFTNERALDGKIRFLKNICGLWLIQQCRASWNKNGFDLSYDEISKAALSVEPFKFSINPDHDLFLNPSDMPEAILKYCKATEQQCPENYAEMSRGIYESLALYYRYMIEKLENIVDKKIETIYMVGGGIQAEILCQFTANASGKRVVTGPVEATALGNILVQLLARGEISTRAEGREIINNSVKLKEYLPQSEEKWQQRYLSVLKYFN